MDSVISRKAMGTFVPKRSMLLMRMSVVMLLITAVGCQSNQAESATVVVEETQPPSTAKVIPTATPAPTETLVPTGHLCLHLRQRRRMFPRLRW